VRIIIAPLPPRRLGAKVRRPTPPPPQTSPPQTRSPGTVAAEYAALATVSLTAAAAETMIAKEINCNFNILADAFGAALQFGGQIETMTPSFVTCSVAVTLSKPKPIPPQDRDKPGTDWPDRPKKGCTCNVSVKGANRAEQSSNGSFQMSVYGGTGKPICLQAYKEGLKAGKRALELSNVHHDNGKCVDSNGNKFRGIGGSIFSAN
jgi:hypothetical protein